MERLDDRGSDYGSLILILILALSIGLISGRSRDSVGLVTLLLVFLGPALCAWGAAVILRRVARVPEMPSLLLWLLCLAGSGMPFPIERAVSIRVPVGLETIGVIGRLCLHFVEGFLILSACGTLIVGLTMVPVLWCVERSRSSFFEIVDVGRCLAFFAILLVLGRRVIESLSGG